MRQTFIFFQLLLICIASHAYSHADSLVGSAHTATLAAAHVDTRLKTVFGAAPQNPSKTIELYKIRYRSQGEKGTPVTLTGLVAWPRGGALKGLVIYNHGATADRNHSPSRYKGTANSSESELAVLTFASGGYAVAMPDYIGLGDDPGPHPFPLGSINNRSAIDLIIPARTLAIRHRVAIGPHLFVTGYSEGGAVAMWTVRALENKPGAAYRVTAAVPMSGPYDLSGVTRESLLAPSANVQEFSIRLFLLSYMVNSFRKSHGLRLTDYFAPTMAATVSAAYGKNLSDINIIKRIALTAILMKSKSSLDAVLTPRFSKALKTTDKTDPLVRALLANDCYDWSPRTKMLLIALKNDTVVSSANTEKAIQAMRARGIGPDLLRQHLIINPKLNHLTGAVPAFALAHVFFDGGFAAVN